MGESIFIVSGEESGDMHGAALLSALKELMPSLKAVGMGGERMRREGLTGLDSREVSVVGIVEVAEKLPGILKAFRTLKGLLRSERFDAVVLIDLPDFNLRFAKEAKKLGIPIIYYISPQVWAWRKNRIKKIAALVDKMLVVFPFEVEIYRNAGVDVEYVGHPLAQTAVCDLTVDEARSRLSMDAGATVVALLPGSRSGEVKRMLGPLLGAASLLEKSLGRKCVFVVPVAGSLEPGLVDGILKDAPGGLDVRVVKGRMYEALRASNVAAVASGTATLETALIGTPMVIVYRMSSISYRIARMLVGVEAVGLPNIIAGRRLVPELLQNEASPEKISAELAAMLTDGGKRAAVEQGYSEIRKSLGKGGAARNAAAAVRNIITGRGAAGS